jgi:hypothetical protein
LNGFFDLWFGSHLLPDVQVRSRLEKQETGILLKISVSQLNADFVFPLWVSWGDERGVPHREKLIVDRRNKTFEFPLPAPPRNFKVNPERAVPGQFTQAED